MQPELEGGGDEDELVSIEETSFNAELQMKGFEDKFHSILILVRYFLAKTRFRINLFSLT